MLIETQKLRKELNKLRAEMGLVNINSVKKIISNLEVPESADEPMCLKCGGVIEYDDCYDTECDGDWVERFYCGHCVDCETDHLWSELYQFKGIEKLRIENEEGFKL